MRRQGLAYLVFLRSQQRRQGKTEGRFGRQQLLLARRG